eukprot:jgi/Bigna1/77177/fgenesh1_pg.46_\
MPAYKVRGQGAVTEIVVDPNKSYTGGRSRSNDIFIRTDKGVSGKHFKIWKGLRIENFGRHRLSVNGVVSNSSRMQLKDGDIISLGHQTTLLIRRKTGLDVVMEEDETDADSGSYTLRCRENAF